MTVDLELPPDIEAGLLAQAQAQGLDVSRYVQNLLREQVLARANTTAASHPAYDLPPEEWIREFRAWAHSHTADNFPILSDEAIGRESIYEDSGL
jgi:hypothetical protein